jgi:hypothetical protein
MLNFQAAGLPAVARIARIALDIEGKGLELVDVARWMMFQP